MEQLLAQFCTMFYLNYPTIDRRVCNPIVTSTYIQTGTKNAVDLTQSFATKEFYKVVDQKMLGTVAGTYGIYDAYKKREIKLTTPLKPICNSLSLDLTDTSVSYNLGWTFNW